MVLPPLLPAMPGLIWNQGSLIKVMPFPPHGTVKLGEGALLSRSTLCFLGPNSNLPWPLVVRLGFSPQVCFPRKHPGPQSTEMLASCSSSVHASDTVDTQEPKGSGI